MPYGLVTRWGVKIRQKWVFDRSVDRTQSVLSIRVGGGDVNGCRRSQEERISRSRDRAEFAISSGSATRSASTTRPILVNRAVVAVADRADRGHQPRIADHVGEGPRGELDSVIGVHDPARAWLAVLDCLVESVDDEIRVLTRCRSTNPQSSWENVSITAQQ